MAEIDRARTDVGKAIAASARIVIVSHAKPDPDTVGSALGLAGILRAAGKDVTVLVPHTDSKSVHAVNGWATVEHDPSKQRAAVATADLVVAVDNTGLARFGDLDWVFPAAATAGITTVNIDHHRTNERFATFNLVDATAAACAQVVFDLAISQGWSIPADAANALFAALRSDTGGFAYPTDYARVFDFASALARHGADVTAITVAQTALPHNQMRFLSEVYAATRIDANGYAKVVITQAMMQRAGVTGDDAYIAVGALNQLEKMRILAVLIEVSPSQTRVSIRTRGESADRIASALGGGGHAAAAGAIISAGTRSALRQVDRAVAHALTDTGKELG